MTDPRTNQRTIARIARCTIAACLLVNGACATFANVRSAAVDQGSSFQTQVSMAGHPGPVAGWFWSFECEYLCPTEAPPGVDVNYTYGWRAGSSGPAVSVGGGIASVIPYVDGYVQLSDSKDRPFGVGARVGSTGNRWIQEQVYGRADLRLADNLRVLWNPGVFLLNTRSPDGFGKGSFVGITQGVGLQIGAGNVVLTPSIAGVWGTAHRTAYSTTLGPEFHLFGTVGVAIGFRHDPRR